MRPPEETGPAGGGADPQADEDIPEEDTQADEESADTEPDRSRNGDDGQSSSADEPAEQEAQRPDNMSQWTRRISPHWREDDNNLAQAVTALGQKSVGNAQVVPLLVSLLAVEGHPPPRRMSDEEEDQSNASPDDELDAPEGIRASEDIVRAVVHALSRNNTPQSLAVLKDMLFGEQTAPLALRELVSEIVKALAEDVNHEKEAILAVLLTKPEAITARLTEAEAAGDATSPRRAGPGRGNAVSDDLGGSGDDTGPLWLQELVLTEAAQATSNRFRSGMARYLQDPEVPAETAELVEQFLVQSDPRNVEAQVILYSIPHTQEQTIQQIEQSLTEGSEQGPATVAWLLLRNRRCGVRRATSRPIQATLAKPVCCTTCEPTVAAAISP